MWMPHVQEFFLTFLCDANFVTTDSIFLVLIQLSALSFVILRFLMIFIKSRYLDLIMCTLSVFVLLCHNTACWLSECMIIKIDLLSMRLLLAHALVLFLLCRKIFSCLVVLMCAFYGIWSMFSLDRHCSESFSCIACRMGIVRLLLS